MASRWDTVMVNNEPMKVYLALPDGPGPHPGVVVTHHIGGVDKSVENMVDRMAEAGYVAAAPDFFHRNPDINVEELEHMDRGDPRRMPMIEKIQERIRDTQHVEDAQATVEYLRQLSGVQVGPLGVTGCCMGGRIAYLLASQISDFQAAAPYYPGGVMVARGDGPSPYELTADIGCPVIGFFGDDDKNPSPEDVQKLREALTKHGKSFELHSYSGAGHGFLNSLNSSSYREGPAKDAWARMLGFFEKHLKAQVGATAGT